MRLERMTIPVCAVTILSSASTSKNSQKLRYGMPSFQDWERELENLVFPSFVFQFIGVQQVRESKRQ